jgi:periplasmic divalent cation tolerance protein
MILIAAGSQAEADSLAELLVSQHLAACVQVIPISSTYRWQGKLHKEAEFLLLVKTRAALYAQVEAAILANHSYELPEVLQIPVTAGLDRYLSWIDENTEST